MESFAITESSLRVATHVIENLTVNRAACDRACTDEIHATERVNGLVKRGIPFRDAYRQVAAKFEEK